MTAGEAWSPTSASIGSPDRLRATNVKVTISQIVRRPRITFVVKNRRVMSGPRLARPVLGRPRRSREQGRVVEEDGLRPALQDAPQALGVVSPTSRRGAASACRHQDVPVPRSATASGRPRSPFPDPQGVRTGGCEGLCQGVVGQEGQKRQAGLAVPGAARAARRCACRSRRGPPRRASATSRRMASIRSTRSRLHVDEHRSVRCDPGENVAAAW